MRAALTERAASPQCRWTEMRCASLFWGNLLDCVHHYLHPRCSRHDTTRRQGASPLPRNPEGMFELGEKMRINMVEGSLSSSPGCTPISRHTGAHEHRCSCLCATNARQEEESHISSSQALQGTLTRGTTTFSLSRASSTPTAGATQQRLKEGPSTASGRHSADAGFQG